MIVDPSGKIVINHLKYAYGLGTPINEVDLQTVDTPYGRLSGVLCGDLDYTARSVRRDVKVWISCSFLAWKGTQHRLRGMSALLLFELSRTVFHWFAQPPEASL